MRKQKKKSSGILWILLGCLLITASLGLTLYNRREAAKAGEAAADTLEKIKEEIPEEVTEKLLPQIYTEEQDKQKEMPLLEIDGHSYIGFLSIPALKLELPVMSDWDYKKLNLAPCRYSGSYYTDDLVIAGHNYTSHFGSLKWLEPGTDLYFTNADGLTWHYVVDYAETVKPFAIEEMTTGDWDLSLFTCTTDGRSRHTVRCIRAV